MLRKFFRRKKNSNHTASNVRNRKNYDVVVHIGAPKTGSSAIQKFLYQNRKALGREGYWYPEHAMNPNGISAGHSAIAFALRDGTISDAKKIFDEWEAAAKRNNQTLLISSESFFNRAHSLKEIICDRSVLVISYQRDIIEYLASSHNQMVKKKFETRDFEEYMIALMETSTKPKHMVTRPFSSIYFEWAEVAGIENLIVRPYNASFFQNNRIEKDFLRILNIESHSQFKMDEGLINRSYTLHALELKRMLNHVLDRNEKSLNKKIDTLLQAFSDRNDKKIEKCIALSPETLAKLIQYTADDYDQLHRVYLKEKLEKKYFPTDVSVDRERLKDVFNSLMHHRDIQRYIRRVTLARLDSRQNLTYSVYSLAELLGTPHLERYENRVGDGWFNEKQLSLMGEGKYREPDFLRDVAAVLKDRGDLTHAGRLIDKALELRPEGPDIKKLREEINEESRRISHLQSEGGDT